MRFVFFKTPKPKEFNFYPRYYDPKKEEIERRRAARGLKGNLSRHETLRLQMSKRWKKGEVDPGNKGITKLIVYGFYVLFIFGSIYLILFTDFVEKLLLLFGLTNN